MKVTSTARYERQHGEYDKPFTAEELQEFLNELPAEAVINAIIRDVGSQRDPDRRMVGLTAVWEMGQ